MGDVLVLDPACFVWDENEFKANKSIYYELLDNIIETIYLLEEHNVKFMLSSNTIDEMINGFPVGLVDQEIKKNNLSETINLIFSFLSKVPDNIIDYIPKQPDIYSIPVIYRTHFSSDLKKELDSLLKEISITSEQISYLTIEEIWRRGDKLDLFNYLSNLIKTIDILKTPFELEFYLNKCKRSFQPSPKHQEGGWGTILPEYLEKQCYELIETAVEDPDNESEALYEYCQEYEQFVIFRKTVNHIYHAYPITSVEVPKSVKRILFNR